MILQMFSTPLVLLTAFSFLLVLINTFDEKGERSQVAYLVFLGLSLGLSILELFKQEVVSLPEYMTNMLNFSHTTAVFDILFITGGILTIWTSKRYFKRMYKNFGEMSTLIIFSIIGMMLIAHAKNMIVLFIGIEIMSIVFYILSAIIRTNVYAVEAGLKYFIMGAFASGFLLMGISFTYGSTGTMYLSDMVTAEAFDNMYFIFGLTMLFIGLMFKMAVIPFHQWAPDVYTGAPTPITAFMSTAGKAGAVTALIVIADYVLRLQSANIVPLENIDVVQNVIAVLSAITMIVGNAIALVQKNAKRMLAYSSIAHAGYILMGISAMNQAGFEAAMFYSLVYLFMQSGAFMILQAVENKDKFVIQVNDFAGFRYKEPFLAALMAAFMFSLVGIPPFGGFMGKLLLFKAAIDAGMLWLTFTAIIGSLVSVFFYINIVIQMYFRQESNLIEKVEKQEVVIPVIITAVLMLILGVFPGLVM